MPSKKINLLLVNKKVTSWGWIKLWIPRIAVVSLIVFICSLLTLLSINFFLIPQRSTIADETKRAKEIIDQHREVEGLYTVLLKKLEYIDRETTQRFPYGIILKNILQLVPDGVNLKNLSIDSNGAVTLSAISTTPEQLKLFTEALLTQESMKPYVVILKGTTRNNDGSYSVSFFLKRGKV